MLKIQFKDGRSEPVLLTAPGKTMIKGRKLVDSLVTTDIYMSYRKIGDATWSVPMNVSNDRFFDKETWTPKVVRDERTVPVFARSNRL